MCNSAVWKHGLALVIVGKGPVSMILHWVFFSFSTAVTSFLVLAYGLDGHLPLVLAFAGLSLWQFTCLLHAAKPSPPPAVLQLGGFSWTLSDFCRGWLITGKTGSGKTAAAINTMLWQVSKNCPKWGGVCIDDKGVYWETVSSMFTSLGRKEDLILLQVRPENAGPEWKPLHCFNFLDSPHLPYSAKAKLICDVAASLGQRSEQSFFRTQAQVQIEFAFNALGQVGLPVTLKNAYELLTSDTGFEDVMEMVAEEERPGWTELIDHYTDRFKSQPAEQLGGVKTTIANYLKPFTDPDLAEIFCPPKSSFDFDAIGDGKVICVSIPQRYSVERRYINTLLKLAFYARALRRFDQPAEERIKNNLMILWADEAQKIVTAADDGMSDYNVMDVLRETNSTVVAATQSHISLIPPMGDERKAKVFMANAVNRVTFCASDEDSAKMAADTLGRRKAKKRTVSQSGGKRSTSWTEEDKYYFEPYELRKLRKFEAVVQHCEGGFRRIVLPPMGPDGKKASWF